MSWGTVREIFDPKNVFMALLNILIFVLVQLAFTIVTAHQLQKDIIIAKSKPAEVFLQEGTEKERKTFCSQKPSMTQEEIDRQSELRISKTILVAKEFFFYPVLTILIIMGICVVLFRFRFNLMDLFIVVVIFAAFSTELFYYYAIVKNFEFVPVLQMLQEYLKPGSTREVESIGADYTSYHFNSSNNLYYRCSSEEVCQADVSYCGACGKCVVNEYCKDGKKCFLVNRDLNELLCPPLQLPSQLPTQLPF